MPRFARTITFVAVLVLLVAALGPAALIADTRQQEPAAESVAVATIDDEVVLVLSTGYIRVEDPHTDAGEEPAVWTSPEAGWGHVATGDFNGDGDAEIIALGGARAKIYDPFKPAGAPAATFDMDISPYTWVNAIAADTDNDGRDELILLRTDFDGSVNWRRLWVYDGNAAGTVWNRTVEVSNPGEWAEVAAGNFLGDGQVNLAVSPGWNYALTVFNGRTGSEITTAEFGAAFVRLRVGDFNHDGRDEIAALRDVIVPFANLVIFRVNGIGAGFSIVYSQQAGQAFLLEAAGDYDKDGADELAMERNLEAPSKGLVSVDLYDPKLAINDVVGVGWHNLAAGDLYGDGYAVLVMLKAEQVRAYYLSPALNLVWSRSGAYGTGLAVGNVDGAGIVLGPILNVAPTTLNFQMVSRGASPAPQQVSVTNSGTADAIAWTATESPATDWLTVTPAGGNTPGSFQVAVNGAVAPPGISQARIIVSAGAGVINSPVTVTVNLNVTAPTLVVSPTRIAEKKGRPGAPQPQEVVHVTQAAGGSGSINWFAAVIYKEVWQSLQEKGDAVTNVRLSESGLDAEIDGQPVHFAAVPWVQIAPDHGSTPTDILVNYQTAGLAGGLHEATIVVDAGSGVINRLGYCDLSFRSIHMNVLPIILK